MSIFMEWVASNVILTLIILVVVLTVLVRQRSIGLFGVILAVIIAGYVLQFSEMNQSAARAESKYEGCLQRELCARSTQRCNACASAQKSDLEKCLMGQIAQEDLYNDIYAICGKQRRSSDFNDTLKRIWNAIIPF